MTFEKHSESLYVINLLLYITSYVRFVNWGTGVRSMDESRGGVGSTI